jgi:hypothetical protein
VRRPRIELGPTRLEGERASFTPATLDIFAIMDEYLIKYEGTPARVGLLISALRSEGAVVQVQPGPIWNNLSQILSSDASAVSVTLITTAATAAFKAGLAKFRKAEPHGKVR